MSFFGEIGFGRVGIPELTDDNVALVASIDDLFGTKLKVLLQRVEAKDYYDIAALIESGASLGRGLAAGRAIFGRTFQPSEALKALSYFEGGDLPTLGSETRRTLQEQVRRVGDLPALSIVSSTLGV